jgi:hypothetical protein
VYIPSHPSQETARSKELAARLRHTIADYSRAHPMMSRAEIEAAIAAVKSTEKRDASGEWKVPALWTGVGTVIALMLGVIASNSQRGISPLLPVLGIAVIGIIAGAFAFVKWRDR